MSEQSDTFASNQIDQNTQGDRNQTIGQVHGGIIVYVSGGQAIINPTDVATTELAKPGSQKLGPNPYKGLLAFNENDGDRYFGRSDEIQTLWNKFRDLYGSDGKTRLLPIYGPSGSGKSSLARAGLLPELGRRPLPGREKARVAVLVPGNDPLYSLAVVLAKIATEDPNPVEKADEFKRVLKKSDDSGEFNGLNRIAFGLPEISTSPLIVLVDQFEEIYSYEPQGNSPDYQRKREKFVEERNAFIKNLLYAASDRSQYVSAIITFRSDFLGETHNHPQLNQLFSKQGFLVSVMDEKALREAIALPAKLAGYKLDDAVVALLIQETKGREGALPLLEFALTRIWEKLSEQEPTGTLREIGGVGGGLAEEAQRIYDALSPSEKTISRQIFLGLVQIGEGSKTTRRRVNTNDLIPAQINSGLWQKVIRKFASSGVRLITLDSINNIEIAEITHEALIDNWSQLQTWLNNDIDRLRFQRRLEEAAQYWDKQERPEGLLWRSPDLNLLVQYVQTEEHLLTDLQLEFFKASTSSERKHKHFQLLITTGLVSSLILTTASGLFAFSQLRISKSRQIEALAVGAEALKAQHPADAVINAVAAIGLQRPFASFPFRHPVTNADPLSLLHLVLDNQEINLLQHDEPVNVVKFTPDSQNLITTSWDRKIRVWDVESGQQIVEPFDIADSRTYAVEFFTGSNIMVSGGTDKKIYIWDTKDWKLVDSFPSNHEGAIRALAFSPDGKTLASASTDKTIKFWDLEIKTEIKEPLKGHEDGIYSIAFSPDGKTIVSASLDNTVRHWNVVTGKLLYPPMKTHRDAVYSVVFSPDGSTIVSGSRDRTLQRWNASTGKPIGPPLYGHEASIYSVAFSSDGENIVSGSEDHDLRIWNSKTGNQVGRVLSTHIGPVHSVAYSLNGQFIASGSSDETVRIWQNKRIPPIASPIYGHSRGILSVTFSPNDQLVASSGYDSIIRLWNVNTGEILHSIHLDEFGVANSLAFSHNNHSLIAGHNGGLITIWDIKTGQLIGEPIKAHEDNVRTIAIDPGDSWIASGGDDNLIRLWNYKTGKLIGEPWDGHEGSVWSVNFNPDGTKLVSGSLDGTIRQWDSQTGQQIGSSIEGHIGDVYSVEFSPDGQIIASAGEDKTIRLWSSTNHQLIGLPLQGHQDTVTSLSFSPNGQTIASSSYDLTVRRWSVETQKALGQTLQGHEAGVISVDHSNAGLLIVSGSADSTLRLWTTDWQDLLEIACQELSYYPGLRFPETQVAKDAQTTCTTQSSHN